MHSRALLLSLLLLTACTASLDGSLETTSAEVRAEIESLERFARDGWHLPFKVRAFGSVEHTLLAQLRELRRAYADSPFDIYAADITQRYEHPSEGERAKTKVEFHPDALLLEVEVSQDSWVSAESLLEAVVAEYRWEREAKWYADESDAHLVAALRRDLGKLRRLADELALDCRRLELLSATLEQRAKGDDPAMLTPSEAEFARAAQYRATFAINRVLNTLARWRVASSDPGFPRRREALTVAYHARLIHDVSLDWLLSVIAGGRTKIKIWRDDWWSRNTLYKALDGAGPAQDAGGKVGVPILAGGIRALLSLRLDGDLRSCFDRLDEAWENRLPRSGDDPLAAELQLTTQRMAALRALKKEKDFDGFTAFKELWDARFKNTVKVPFYGLVSSVARFLGDTRVTHPDPAVSDAQLAVLERELRPGDVVLVRQTRYLSNAFLPGFWPHALLYLGPVEAWTRLKLADGTRLADDPIVRATLLDYRQPIRGNPARVIEAISEGVVFNSLEHAVQKDYVVVLRPELPESKVAAGIRRVLRFLGRPYDFNFDFATDDKLVCTELVYRAYDADLAFSAGDPKVPGVVEVMGRQTMPANEIARLVLYMAEHPEPNPKTKYPGRRLRLVSFFDRTGNEAAEHLTGAAAMARLRESVAR